MLNMTFKTLCCRTGNKVKDFTIGHADIIKLLNLADDELRGYLTTMVLRIPPPHMSHQVMVRSEVGEFIGEQSHSIALSPVVKRNAPGAIDAEDLTYALAMEEKLPHGFTDVPEKGATIVTRSYDEQGEVESASTTTLCRPAEHVIDFKTPVVKPQAPSEPFVLNGYKIFDANCDGDVLMLKTCYAQEPKWFHGVKAQKLLGMDYYTDRQLSDMIKADYDAMKQWVRDL